jgi:hypothetical protein
VPDRKPITIRTRAEHPTKREHRWRTRLAFVGPAWQFQLDRVKSADGTNRCEWRCFIIFGHLGLMHIGEGRGSTQPSALRSAVRRSREKLANISASLDKFAEQAAGELEKAIATEEGKGDG